MAACGFPSMGHVEENPFTRSSVKSAITNPFSDSKAQSRVTASGFTESTNNPLLNSNTQFSTTDMMQEILKLKDKIEFMESNSPKEQDMLNARSILSNKLHQNDKEIRSIYNSTYEGESSDEDRTINPNDSASMMRPLELRTKTHPMSENQCRSTISYGYSNFDNVIGGYGLSSVEKMCELDSMVKITKISNLPIIFINERLNFLTHLHKPLYNLLEEDGKYPSKNCLGRIRRFMSQNHGKERGPEEQLLYTAIKCSIDIPRMKVKSNPFNFPVIEPGMRLDDEIIYMTFSNLHSEFEIIWFNCMKNAQVPKFHSKFRSSNKDRSSNSRHSTASKQTRTGSILSLR